MKDARESVALHHIFMAWNKGRVGWMDAKGLTRHLRGGQRRHGAKLDVALSWVIDSES